MNLATLLVFLLAASIHAAEPLRILCIGDSITQGGKKDREEWTYRLPLQEMLREAGVSFDFIGSRQQGLQPEAKWPDVKGQLFDPDHEGYYGAKTARVLDKLKLTLPKLAAPDIALIHLGTNDQKSDNHAATIVKPLEEIVAMLRAKNPKVRVLIAHLNFNGGAALKIRPLVEDMAQRLSSVDSPVITVHHYRDWKENPKAASTDTFDWAHPNPQGQRKMAAAWFAAMSPAQSAVNQPQRIGGFVVAGHAWTWGKGTIFEAIDATKAAGCDALEVFLMGQKISAETGDIVLDETTPDDVLDKLKAKCASAGVRLLNAYIGQNQWKRIAQNEAQLRPFFELGRKLGLTGFTGEPAEAQWDMVERLVREFDLTFGIHNHAKGFEAEYLGGPYRYWDPRVTAGLLKDRDDRMGLCLDTGHAARSGLDVLEVTRACAGRILSVHLKDVMRVKLHDVPYGHGMVNIPDTLNELRKQKIRSHIALEYEWFESPTFATDVKTLVEFIRSSAGGAGICFDKSLNVRAARNFWYADIESSDTGFLAFDEAQDVMMPEGRIALQRLNQWDDITHLETKEVFTNESMTDPLRVLTTAPLPNQ